MNREPQNDPLAAWTDRALKQLPLRPAPASLMLQVLAAIRRQAALPWYRRPWLSWPRGLQLVSALSLSALIGAVIWLVTQSGAPVEAAALAQRAETSVGLVGSVAEALGRATLVVLRSLSTPVVIGLLSMLGAAYLSCIGLGSACWRVACRHR
jgi:hypothetical protein